MAGEWIPIDIGIGQKPEIQELVDITGAAVETVVYRLIGLWGWCSLHTSDGVIRATPERLARLHGGDAAFWTAVETVGWVRFDAAAGTMTVSGWETRFSKAAKARAADRIRKSIGRQQDSGAVPGNVQDLSADPRTDSGLEERTVTSSSSSAGAKRIGREARAEDIVRRWDERASRSGKLKSYLPADPPAAIWDRLAERGWADLALQAIDRLPECRYFDDPPTLRQFCGPGFVAKVLDGTFDNPKRARSGPETSRTAPAEGRVSADEAAKRWARRDPKVVAAVAEREALKRRAKA